MFRARQATFLLLFTLGYLALCCCSRGGYQFSHRPQSISLQFQHFEGGRLFIDAQTGLDILWKASFAGSVPYKETVAYFIDEGLLILPNSLNTARSGKVAPLSLQIVGQAVFVLYDGTYRRIRAIIHTHPDPCSLPMPAPGKDFPFSGYGIHNYIMDFGNLLDAYVDRTGNEVFSRIGDRDAYSLIPESKVKVQSSGRSR
jgi:hypothetical protein